MSAIAIDRVGAQRRVDPGYTVRMDVPPSPPVVSTEPISQSAIEIYRNGLIQNPRITLILLHRQGIRVAHLTEGQPLVVGREPPSTVCLPDATLSREHARLCLQNGLVHVQDLGSTNGTWLAGERIRDTRVEVGTELMLGGVMARIRLLDSSPADVGSYGFADDDSEDSTGLVAGPVMKKLLETARRVADSRIPVILRGETGCGKEVLARFIHEHGPRKQQPMVAVNCAAIPAHLVESTLFGHERGAFTGAVQTKKGVFEVADGGTVFLDELGELPLAAQAVLLRVLEVGRFSRVGGSGELHTDVRIIAATHRNVQHMVENKTFRADLFYRLNTMILAIPPLRERKDEIAPLTRRFLVQANKSNNRAVSGITPEALSAMRAYHWPGNVRELHNVIERAVVITKNPSIRVEDLPESVQARHADGSDPPVPNTDARESVGATSDTDAPAPDSNSDLRTQMQDYEARLIRQALEQCDWNRTEAAQKLGMSTRTLRHKVKAFGIVKQEI